MSKKPLKNDIYAAKGHPESMIALEQYLKEQKGKDNSLMMILDFDISVIDGNVTYYGVYLMNEAARQAIELSRKYSPEEFITGTRETENGMPQCRDYNHKILKALGMDSKNLNYKPVEQHDQNVA